MKKATYDDQLLTQYLLGLLPEQASERLDELSFTDDELAARLQVVENDLVDAYIRGELTGPTLERFDSYYLAAPGRREKVAFARGLQTVIDRAATIAPIGKPAALAEPPGKVEPWRRQAIPGSRFFVWRWALQRGVAVALLLVLAAGAWLWFENLRLRDQMNQSRAEREALQQRAQELETQLQQQHSSDSEKTQELASLRERIAQLEQQTNEQPGGKSPPPHAATEPNIIGFTLAPQTRGTANIAEIPIAADTVYVTMRLELEPSDFTTYRAELKRQPAGEVVWKSSRVRAKAAGDGKILVVVVRAALLKMQRYQMEVYGISSGGAVEPISSYPFRVVKQ